MKGLVVLLWIVILGSCKANFELPGNYNSNGSELIIYGDGTYYLVEDIGCYFNYYYGICSYSSDSIRFSPDIQHYVERKIIVDSTDCKSDCYIEFSRIGNVNYEIWLYLSVWDKEELVKEMYGDFFFSKVKLEIENGKTVDRLKIGLKPLHIWSNKSFEMPISINKNYLIQFNDEIRRDSIPFNNDDNGNFTHQYKKLKPNKLKLRSKYGRSVYLKR